MKSTRFTTSMINRERRGTAVKGGATIATLATLVILCCIESEAAQTGERFLRGDTNASGSIEIVDPIRIFGFLFTGDPAVINCMDTADADDSGRIAITDGIYLLEFLFRSGNQPPSPFPDCGVDPSDDSIDCTDFPENVGALNCLEISSVKPLYLNPKYETGIAPVYLTLGDLNNDGNLDAAVANANDPSLSILFGTGQVDLLPLVPVHTNGGQDAVLLEDWNDDAILDLAVAVSSRSIKVFLRKGDGSIIEAPSITLSRRVTSLASADLNGDRHRDLVFTSGTAWVALGAGNGSFSPPVSYSLQGANEATSVAIGDFNGDGWLDLAGADMRNAFSVRLGNGDGTFGDARLYIVNQGPQFIAAGDVEGDGDIDLVGSPYAQAPPTEILFSVFPNQGNGVFGSPKQTSTERITDYFKLRDLDGDGNLDAVALASQRVGAFVLRGIEGGVLKMVDHIYTVGPVPTGLDLGDMDGDAISDLVVVDRAVNQAVVLRGTPNGEFLESPSIVVGERPTAIASGDLDGDGRLDLATANFGSGDVSILFNKGAGVFVNAVNQSVGTPQSLAIGDLNEDAAQDFAVTEFNDQAVNIFINNSGRFEKRWTYRVPRGPEHVAMTDLDADSHLDLAVATLAIPEHFVSVLRGHGDGTFAQAESYEVSPGPRYVAPVDLNGDSLVDLVVACSINRTVAVLSGRGDGTFVAPMDYPIGIRPEIEPWSIAPADLDGDGDVDLVVANRNFSSEVKMDFVSILVNLGDGTFPDAKDFIIGFRGSRNAHERPIDLPTGLGLADFDGDLRLDIVATSSGGDNVSLIRNDGRGGFSDPEHYAAGNLPTALISEDLDEDGDLDVAVTAFMGNKVHVLMNQLRP